MLLPCELWQRGKLFLPIDESGDWCVCVWSQQAECAARNVDGKRECELGASVAMIRARDQNFAKEGWVGGSSVQMPSVVTSRAVWSIPMRVRGVWIGAAGLVKRRVDACKHRELPNVLRTRVSGDVGGRGAACFSCAAASDPIASKPRPPFVMEQAVSGDGESSACIEVPRGEWPQSTWPATLHRLGVVRCQFPRPHHCNA
jgi:hypothetical protein